MMSEKKKKPKINIMILFILHCICNATLYKEDMSVHLYYNTLQYSVTKFFTKAVLHLKQATSCCIWFVRYYLTLLIIMVFYGINLSIKMKTLFNE